MDGPPDVGARVTGDPLVVTVPLNAVTWIRLDAGREPLRDLVVTDDSVESTMGLDRSCADEFCLRLEAAVARAWIAVR